MIRFVVLTMFSLLVLSSAMVQAAPQELTVDVLNAPGAECRGTTAAGHAYEWASTPGSTVVEVHGPLTVECANEGFESATVTIDPEPSGSSILVFGVLGSALLSNVTDDLLVYPSPVELVLKPDATAAPEVQAEYARLVAQHEAEADWDE